MLITRKITQFLCSHSIHWNWNFKRTPERVRIAIELFFFFFFFVVVDFVVLGKALKVYIQLLNGRMDGPGSGKLFKQTFSPANDGKGTFYRQFTGSGENCETKTKKSFP